MFDLQSILQEEYKKKKASTALQSLLEMIEDVLEIDLKEESAPTVPVDDFAAQEMIMRMIPDIAVSEIGWSDVRTSEEGEPVSGPQRQLLIQFLNNVDGSNFEERIKSISSFYSSGATQFTTEASDRGELIAKTISYLVFYKTLTKVITNFNASSAGFSFESFLAALVDGEQIKANSGTIADYIDKATGTDIPVSLKLYREGQLEVGGSYSDLVNDLIDPQWPGFGNAMRYVVCTKALSGKELKQEGTIKFWQFDFTLDNVLAILVNSKATSKECIRLPRAVVSALQGGQRSGIDNVLGLPEKELFPPAGELEVEFTTALGNQISAIAQANPSSWLNRFSAPAREDLLSDLQWSQDGSDPLFSPIVIKVKDDETGETQTIDKGVIRGRSGMVSKAVKDWLEKKYYAIESEMALQQLFQVSDDNGFTPKQRAAMVKEFRTQLDKAIRNANAEIVDKYKPMQKKSERNRMLDDYLEQGEFLSPAESAKMYSQLGAAQKKIALRNSLGYLRTLHFSLNQKQATNESAPSIQSKQVVDPKNPKKLVAVKGGAGAQYLGEIHVGTKHVSQIINQVRDILNAQVFEIFESLRTLSESLNSYFAGGLKNDTQAGHAVSNAENIVSKTEDVREK
jgi:hypothetical protein